jgi:hypothetical protein
MVEESLDRIPARTDPHQVADAFDDMKSYLQLVDGWRNTFPTRLEYTYTQ